MEKSMSTLFKEAPGAQTVERRGGGIRMKRNDRGPEFADVEI